MELTSGQTRAGKQSQYPRQPAKSWHEKMLRQWDIETGGTGRSRGSSRSTGGFRFGECALFHLSSLSTLTAFRERREIRVTYRIATGFK
jgi:hypothetical protein